MRLSLVIPVYNEADALPMLLDALGPVLASIGCDYEILFVDDGSRDGTAGILDAAASADPRVKVLTFSRNFGHQAAITAGLDFVTGDAVVVMDADLQDPPRCSRRWWPCISRDSTSSRPSGSIGKERARSSGGAAPCSTPSCAGPSTTVSGRRSATSGCSAGRP